MFEGQCVTIRETEGNRRKRRITRRKKKKHGLEGENLDRSSGEKIHVFIRNSVIPKE